MADTDDDNDTNRRRPRRAAAAVFVPYGWLVCCGCLAFLIIVGLIVGIAVTANRTCPDDAPPTETPSSFKRTRSTFHDAGHLKPHGHKAALQISTLQCSSFIDLPEQQQAQTTECKAGVEGVCAAPGLCEVSFFPSGSSSSDQDATFQCTVSATTVCSSTSTRDTTCTCPTVEATCKRDVNAQPLDGQFNFECVEPLVCPSFADISLADQPIVEGEACNTPGQAATGGTCQTAGGFCSVPIETIGAIQSDGVEPGEVLLPATTPCVNAGDPCDGFAQTCFRCTDPDGCNANQVTAFLCAPASQVPNSGSASTLMLSASLIVLALMVTTQ